MRYAMAALLALVLGTQADAQMIRRYARSYTPGYTQYYTTPSYSSYYGVPTYSTIGDVVTAGYYSPYTYSNNYVYPSSYYSAPALGWNTGYGYTNYYGNYGGWGRRGWR